MTLLEIVALLITLTALFSYVNFRFIRLPTTIGVMLVSLLFSLGLIGAGQFQPQLAATAKAWLHQFDFDTALLQGMLSFLLFAGALHLNLGDLARQKWIISALALGGVALSTVLVGTAMYGLLGALGLPLGYPWCLVFGALISPTDPIAVLGILKTVRVPRSLETKIAGESLFNDGVGVVAFIVLLEIAHGGGGVSAGHVAALFLEEAVGGALFGWGAGYVTYRLLKSVDNYQVEVLLTLALVMGGYALASALHLSGPIAIVVAGLFIGNHGRSFAMSANTREHLDTFWKLVDEILNALLFVAIGLEVLALTFTPARFWAGLLAIPVILLARWISVGLPVLILRRRRRFTPGAVTLMTWGGLRGGISVALALSLPAGPERETLLGITYLVVVFSILVQGLTVKPLVRRLLGASPPGDDPKAEAAAGQ